jgi:hypothetical protein
MRPRSQLEIDDPKTAHRQDCSSSRYANADHPTHAPRVPVLRFGRRLQTRVLVIDRACVESATQTFVQRASATTASPTLQGQRIAIIKAPASLSGGRPSRSDLQVFRAQLHRARRQAISGSRMTEPVARPRDCTAGLAPRATNKRARPGPRATLSAQSAGPLIAEVAPRPAQLRRGGKKCRRTCRSKV